jgi:hypothetical protein
VPRNDGWKSANGSAGKECLSGFRGSNQQGSFVIGGYTQPAGERQHVGALLVGLFEKEKLKCWQSRHRIQLNNMHGSLRLFCWRTSRKW